MRLGLCGLPTSGKTTIFSALAGRRLASGKGREDAGQALLPVPDERVDKLSALFNPKKTTYAQVTYLDPPAPLVKADDPATKLPAELRNCDGLIQVVRNFDGGLGAPDAAGDFQAFQDELILGDLITVERRLERIAQERKRGREVDNEEVQVLEKCLAQLESEQPLRLIPEAAGHVKLRGFGLLSAKPFVLVSNNEEDDPAPPDMGGGPAPLVIRAAIEAELAELDEEERAEFMADLGLEGSTLDRLLAASYAALSAISFFTVGEDEVRAWTVGQGALAPQAAGVIHTDLEKGFIRAEVMRYEDLMEHGSEAAVKKAGLMKLSGKDYEVQDGDILHVRFNV
jgi:GTP-binding protein YchF